MLASEGIYTTADQTDPSLIHPIDFRFSSLLGLKLPNTQTPSLICQSSASDRSSSSGVPARRWCDGSSAGQKTPRTFHFISIKDACLQSSVMAGDGGWQLINNERIPFNLWPGSFPDRVCHTDFSLHLSHLTTLLPETKRSKSPERNVHIECLLQISEHWGWWNSFDMLIWAWNWGEIYDTKPRVCSPAAVTYRCALWHHWWVWLQVASRVHRVLSGLLIHRLYFIFIWFWSSFFFVLCWIICCLF